MKFLRSVCLFIGVLLLVHCATAQTRKKTPVDYVNPYIGNISHLLKPTVPTVHLPNSLFRFSPQRADFTSDVMNGFSLDGRVILNPYQGDESGLASSYRFSYDQEKITPYSYSVYLDDQQTTVRLAPCRQSAMYELEYGATGNAYVVINSPGGELNWNGTTLTGKYGLGNKVNGFLCLVPENKPEAVLALNQGQLSKPAGNDACLVLKFDAQSKIQRLKFGISFIDEVQARKNLDREIKNFDIAQMETAGKKIWNEALGKIAVNGGTDNEKNDLLYRTLPVVQPSIQHFRRWPLFQRF